MSRQIHLTVLFILFITAAVGLVGCSQTTQPLSGMSPTADVQTAVAASIAADELTVSKLSGIAIDSSNGEFCIGWNQFVGPLSPGSERLGNAAVIVTNGTVAREGPRAVRGGVDIGSVYLNYSGNHQEFHKNQPRFGGTFYSIFPQLFGQTSTGITFAGGTDYEFEVSGSSLFSPLKISITSPAGLISITSHTNGEQVNADSDIVLMWTGGKPDGSVLVRVTPMVGFGSDGFDTCDSTGRKEDPTEKGRGRGGMHPEIGRLMPGVHDGDLDGPMRIDTGYVVHLPNNPGATVISAATVQQILDGASRLSITVSQLSALEFTHDSGKYRLVMRDGDRRMLNVK